MIYLAYQFTGIRPSIGKKFDFGELGTSIAGGDAGGFLAGGILGAVTGDPTALVVGAAIGISGMAQGVVECAGTELTAANDGMVNVRMTPEQAKEWKESQTNASSSSTEKTETKPSKPCKKDPHPGGGCF